MPATAEAPQTQRPTPAQAEKPAQRPAGTEFPDSEFVTIPNVPIFAEHETESAAEPGRTLKFGSAELAAVCARCNRRIIETGDYAAIVIGHTPSQEEKDEGAKDPELIGMAGPFRMAKIGTGEKQRSCIFADFHVFREDLGKMRKHPRRSPELWLEEDYSEMFLDPIALLGAEAPRLDMGLLYSKAGNPDRVAARMKFLGWAVTQGHKVERYAAACAAMPSAGNTHVLSYEAQPSDKIAPAKAKEMLDNPPHGKALTTPQEHMLEAAAHKDDYAAGQEPEAKTTPKEPTMAITPEDCRMIVEMFMSTDAGQFLQKKMAEEAGTNALVPGESEPPAADLAPEIETPGTAGPAAGIPPGDKPHPFEGPEPPAPNAGPAESIPPASTPPPEKPQPGAPPAAPKPKEKDGMAESTTPEQYAAACKSMDGVKDEDLEKYLAGRWKNHAKHAKYAAESFGHVGAKIPEGTPNGETDGGAKPSTGTAGGRDASEQTTIAGSQLPEKNLNDEHPVEKASTEAYAKRFEAVEKRLQAALHRERYSRLREATQTRVLDLGEEMTRTKEMSDTAFEDHMKVIREHYEKIPVGYYAVPDSPTDFQAEPTNATHGQPEKYRAENVKKAERYCEARKAQGKSVEFGEVLGILEAGQPLPVD